MEADGRSFFSYRVILGVLVGVAASILLISYIQNYLLATVLGMLIAVSVSDLTQPGECTALGFFTGSVAGLYLGVMNFLGTGEMQLDYAGLAASMVGWLLLTGLVCAVYGYILGKFLFSYKRGQGPFF